MRRSGVRFPSDPPLKSPATRGFSDLRGIARNPANAMRLPPGSHAPQIQHDVLIRTLSVRLWFQRSNHFTLQDRCDFNVHRYSAVLLVRVVSSFWYDSFTSTRISSGPSRIHVKRAWLRPSRSCRRASVSECGGSGRSCSFAYAHRNNGHSRCSCSATYTQH